MSKGKNVQSEDLSELLASIQNGSSGAFVRLSEKYAPLLESEVARYTGELGAADVDDLRQGALVSLYRAAVSYKEGKNVTFGLYAKICIVNGIADTLRYIGKRGADLSMDDLNEDELGAREDPEELLLGKEQMRLARQKMGLVLTDLEAEIFELYLSGYSYAEIAELCGRSAKSVDNAIRRVKNKLKKAF